jgi:hypothetical protein
MSSPMISPEYFDFYKLLWSIALSRLRLTVRDTSISLRKLGLRARPLAAPQQFTGFHPAAPPGASEQKPVSEAQTAELSILFNFLTVFSVQNHTKNRGNYKVPQVEPRYLARLNTSGRSPGIQEGAV